VPVYWLIRRTDRHDSIGARNALGKLHIWKFFDDWRAAVGVVLPEKVAWFLGIIGVAWPNVDEDQVLLFATHVRGFATNLAATHQSATDTVKKMGDSYTGESYTALLAAWQSRSKEHVEQLNEACGVVAVALEAAAATISGAKAAAVAELVALAATFAVEQALAVETAGISEAFAVVTVLAARKCVKILIEQLTFYIIAEVIKKAVEPLEAMVVKAANGLIFQALEAALGQPTGPSTGTAKGKAVHVDPDALIAYADTMRGHADEMAEHASRFSSSLGGVKFA
jgi:uncharacterized protein YukE